MTNYDPNARLAAMRALYGPQELTCWSCAHARYAGLGAYGSTRLWCVERNRTAQARCAVFRYEPGSDEAERVT